MPLRRVTESVSAGDTYEKPLEDLTRAESNASTNVGEYSSKIEIDFLNISDQMLQAVHAACACTLSPCCRF